jgi:hypothetical protein
MINEPSVMILDDRFAAWMHDKMQEYYANLYERLSAPHSS